MLTEGALRWSAGALTIFMASVSEFLCRSPVTQDFAKIDLLVAQDGFWLSYETLSSPSTTYLTRSAGAMGE